MLDLSLSSAVVACLPFACVVLAFVFGVTPTERTHERSDQLSERGRL